MLRRVFRSALPILSAVFATVLIFNAGIAAAEKRAALVIGNSQYEHASSLANPVNDARAMSAKLRELGFETVEGYDLTFDEVRTTMRSFARATNGADVSLVFYAGHGISVNGTNYLVPVDAKLDDPIDWEFQVYPMDDILAVLRRTEGASLVFLDACRDNPLASVLAKSMGTSTRSIGARGLAQLNAEPEGSGTAIAFATSPGDVAEDGEGKHSPFTTALLNNIDAANVDISEVMTRVTSEVYTTTEKRQRPWLNSSLTGRVILNKVEEPKPEPVIEPAPQLQASLSPAAPAQPASNGSLSIDAQKFMIETAQQSGDAADYRTYLDVFPNGVFSGLARNAIKRIEEEETKTATTRTTAPQSTQPTSTGIISGQQQQAPADVQVVVLPEPSQTAPAPAQPQIIGNGLLLLPITPALQNAVSSAETEKALGMNKAKRKEVQGRLNAADFNTGWPDGSFGRKSRRGISNWQQANQLPATGYLNNLQLQLLTTQTEKSYEAYKAKLAADARRRAKDRQAREAAASRQSAGSANPPKQKNTVEKLLDFLGSGSGGDNQQNSAER